MRNFLRFCRSLFPPPPVDITDVEAIARHIDRRITEVHRYCARKTPLIYAVDHADPYVLHRLHEELDVNLFAFSSHLDWKVLHPHMQELGFDTVRERLAENPGHEYAVMHHIPTVPYCTNGHVKSLDELFSPDTASLDVIAKACERNNAEQIIVAGAKCLHVDNEHASYIML